MNRIFKPMILAAATLAVSATAKAQCTFTVQDLTGKQGTTISMPVEMNNGDTEVVSFNCDIYLPEGVTVKPNSKNKLAVLDGNRKEDHVITCAQQSDGAYRFLSYSPENEVYYGSSGTIFTSDIELNAEPGVYTIAIKNAIMTDAGTKAVIDCPETTATLTITAASVSLTHGVAYTNDAKAENVDVTYTRTFKHTGWQALYVPFDMAYEDWKGKAQVAELTGATADALVWTTVASGKIAANTPYLIKPANAGETVFASTGATLEAADECTVSMSAGGTTFMLTGIYTEKADMATDNAFGMSKGTFYKASSDAQTLKPYQFYLKIASGAAKAPAAVACLIDGEATSIDGVELAGQGNGKRYDMQGRELRQPGRGIYIENGKKMINK